MTNTIKNIARTAKRVAGAGTLALILSGCNSFQEAKTAETLIQGRPASVSTVSAGYYASLSSIVYTNANNDSGILSKVVRHNGDSTQRTIEENLLRFTDASALIQAEIAKGSNGVVKYYGIKNNGILEIRSIEAGGHK